MPSYWDEVLADSPSFLLKCEESSGNLTDYVASLSGTPSGSALTYRVAGPDATGIPYGVTLALTSVLTVNDNTAIRISASANYTVEAWLKFITKPANTKVFLKKNADDTGTDGITLFDSSTHAWRLADGAGGTVSTGGVDSDTTAWHHWVWVYAGASSKIWRDGVDVTVSAFVGGGGDSTDPLKIGSSQFNASMSGLAFYKSALSSTRVAAHYAARSTGSSGVSGTGAATLAAITSSGSGTSTNPSLPGTSPYDNVVLATAGLVGYWPLGPAGSLTDLLSANNATATGSPTPGVSMGFSAGDTGMTFSAGNYLSVPNSAAYQFGFGNYSMECWFYRASDAVVEEYLLARGVASGHGYEIYLGPGSSPYATSRIGAVFAQTDYPGWAWGGIWHHIIVSMNRAGGGIMYIDGVQSGPSRDITSASASDISENAVTLLGNGTNPLTGGLAKVALYNVALGLADAQTHYAARLASLARGAPPMMVGTAIGRASRW